ncbi:MAG: DNA cytosine methyltransferase [Blautia sp.]
MISGLNEFRILDLFCGAGGLSWGMHKNPYFKTMVALDFDEKAVATFKNNMPGSEVLVGDITDATVKRKSCFFVTKKYVASGPVETSTMSGIFYEGEKTWIR